MLLCSIDLGVGTVVHPLFALKSITMLHSPKCFYIVAYIMARTFFTGISACTLFIMNIERYFAIIHPFLHRIHFTKRRLVLTWVFLWFLVTVFILCRVNFPFLGVLIPVTLCHSFHIIVDVCCNIHRCEKNDVERKQSPY